MFKNLQFLMFAIMQDFKAHGYFSMVILMDIPIHPIDLKHYRYEQHSDGYLCCALYVVRPCFTW